MEIGLLSFNHMYKDIHRKIIHIDMDAFYASVEMRDNPDLQNKPVIIAQHPKETRGRGIVSTCNYIARQKGVHSAMSAKKAYELCPDGVFLPPRIHYYAQISHSIREIFNRYTDCVEPLSLDEAYLDVTYNKKGYKSAMYIAKCIQRDIWLELGLTCSAGVSYNKFLAKVASDYQKPAGLTTITPPEARDFLETLPIEKFYGVGRKSVPVLHEDGIFCGKDVLLKDPSKVLEKYGKMGFLLLQRARGIDHSPVRVNRSRKSVGREKTYFPELVGDTRVQMAIRELALSVSKTLKKLQLKGDTISLKIRYTNFDTHTKQVKVSRITDDEHVIYQEAMLLYEEFGEQVSSIRLLGISVSNVTTEDVEVIKLQLS